MERLQQMILIPVQRKNLGFFAQTSIFFTLLVFTLATRSGAGSTATVTPSMLFLILLIGLYGVACVDFFAAHDMDYWLYMVFIGGGILRALYVSVTSYLTRAHDADAHLEYIQYMAHHFSIPQAAAGWESFQPPLYYFLAGTWVRIGTWLGESVDAAYQVIQTGSLLLSVLALGITFCIGKTLFPRPEQLSSRLVFGTITATMPGLIFTASRISNDILIQVFSFAALALLLRWWKDGENWHWYALCVLLGLSLLTKNTAYLLLPPVIACLLLKREISWGRKCVLFYDWVLILALCAGWLIVVRLLIEQDHASSFIGNVSGTNSALRLPRSLHDVLVFNPLELLKHPFNNPWVDEERRRFFFEYLYRSAFFGEFNFGETFRLLADLIVLSGLGVAAAASVGVWRELNAAALRTFPLWFTAVCLIAGQIVLRMTISFSPLQDFRYSTLIAVPIAYYAASGIASLPLTVRRTLTAVVGGFTSLCATFIIALSLLGS